jgi:predicted transcriptional regulator
MTNDGYVLSLPERRSGERPELARLVDRDVKNVSTALSRMANVGLVAFEREGPAKRPDVWYDEIEVEIRLTAPGVEDSNTAPV